MPCPLMCFALLTNDLCVPEPIQEFPHLTHVSLFLYSGAGHVHTDFVQTNYVCVTSDHCLDCFSDLILCHQDTSL